MVVDYIDVAVATQGLPLRVNLFETSGASALLRLHERHGDAAIEVLGVCLADDSDEGPECGVAQWADLEVLKEVHGEGHRRAIVGGYQAPLIFVAEWSRLVRVFAARGRH